MLSGGAGVIKQIVGITPDHLENRDPTITVNERADHLQPSAKEFISNLEENPVDEALTHREIILQSFYTLCDSGGFEEKEILSWSFFEEICENDELLIEAMNDYSKWGSKKDGDQPMSVYTMGQLLAKEIILLERSEGVDYFSKYSEEIARNCDDETAQAAIAIRRIANGN